MVATDVLRQRLLAHRGIWSTGADPNSPLALQLACQLGVGIETDVRDFMGSLVLSHDPPVVHNPPVAFDEVEKLLSGGAGSMLALNIKADGLSGDLTGVAEGLANWQYFCFDMSWPQTLAFVEADLPVALRVSEWEPLDYSLFARLGIPVRVWLDAFDSEWWLGMPEIDELCTRGQVAVVSPEIHGRPPNKVWEWFVRQLESGTDIYLCTDRCDEVIARFS